MRGKELKSPKLRTKTGITPAYAGKSCRSAFTFSTMSDHPRLCGEKSTKSSCPLMQMGSPPPMRGKVLLPDTKPHLPGITPAYAGKRRKKTVSCTGIWDHPRLCGEKISNETDVSRISGSPPPMRGKGKKEEQAPYKIGITPAYAGKSHCDI